MTSQRRNPDDQAAFEAFTRRLIKSPEQECARLKEAILNAARDYEKAYPAHQPFHVRFVLHRLNDKLDTISPENHGEHQESKSDKRTYQIQYARLCGFLWDAVKTLYDEVNRKSLRQRLLTIALSQAFLQADKPLPLLGELATCAEVYNWFQKAPSLFLDERSLVDDEDKQYESAKKQLAGVMQSEIGPLREIAIELQRQFDTEHSHGGDVKFFTTVLNSMKDVFEAKTSDALYESLDHFQSLIPHAEKVVPSPGCHLLTSFFAIGLVVAGVMGCVVTFGASAPLLGVGTVLLQQAVSGAAAIIGGYFTTSTMFGFGLFAPRGPQPIMQRFHKAAIDALAEGRLPVRSVGATG